MSVSSQLAHLLGTVCLSHSATLILPPLLTLPSRCTYLVTISKLFHSHAYPLIQCVCVCGGGGGWVSFMLLQKHPVLQPCAVDWHSIKPLYYYCHKILLGLVTWKYEDQQHYVYNLNIRFSASWMYFSLQMEVLCLHQSVPVTHKPVFSICDYCFHFGRLFTEILQMVEVTKEHKFFCSWFAWSLLFTQKLANKPLDDTGWHTVKDLQREKFLVKLWSIQTTK